MGVQIPMLDIRILMPKPSPIGFCLAELKMLGAVTRSHRPSDVYGAQSLVRRLCVAQNVRRGAEAG